MKPIFSPFLKISLAAILITPSFALEAPVDDSPPPPPATQKARKLPEFKLQPEVKPSPKTPVAFLGIVSAEVPAILADHLNLKCGEGVVVRSLVPDGPAAKAGIAVNDVITHVAGQAIGSPAEITQRITTLQVGETLALNLIHKGKASQLDVVLGIKPAELVAQESQARTPLNLEDIPKELADRVRKAIEGNLGGLDLQAIDEHLQMPPGIDEAMHDLKKHLHGALGQAFVQPADKATANVQSGATIKMKDQQGSIEVRSKEGAKEVTIRDPQDKITWSGPWDTTQDRAAAPAEVRQRVENLNIDSDFKGTGLRMHMPQVPPSHTPEN